MSDIVRQLLLQLILILLNAFFAATEIAVISLNEKKVKARAEDGDKKAVKMLKMIEEPTRFLSTIQIGITLAGFLGSAFAADNFAEKLSGFIVETFAISDAHIGAVNTAAVIVITLILSFFTLVFGELVPKRVAMKHKDKLAEAVCGTISGLAVVLKPIIWLLTVSANGVLRLFGIDPHEKDEPVSEEDIVLMLDAGADEGSLNENDIEYIKNVFKLDGMTAEDVMTPRRSIVLIPQDAGSDEILATIEAEGYSRIPVYADSKDNIIGILHLNHFFKELVDRPQFDLRSILMPVNFVHKTMPLDDVLAVMKTRQCHMVIVTDEYGGTMGCLTMEDVLEQLVGDIWDESDEIVDEFVQTGDDSYEADGNMRIYDFFEELDIDDRDFDDDNATLGGWAIEMLGDYPKVGDSFDYKNLTITVKKLQNLRVTRLAVQVRPLPPEEEEE